MSPVGWLQIAQLQQETDHFSPKTIINIQPIMYEPSKK